MPSYTYFCKSHGEFEVTHSIKELLEDCPKCQEENIQPPNKITRLISSNISFVLSGGGWAKDNYH